MNDHTLYLSTQDHARLRLLVNSLSSSSPGGTAQKLRQELDRATIMDESALPPNVVRMNDRVEIEDLATGEVEDYTLVFPEWADVEQRRLSVLAPIGTAVLGFAEGDEVHWSTPGGVRRLRIRRVVHPPASEAGEALTTVPRLAFSRWD